MTMTVSTTTMSVDNDACSNIWATNQSLYDIPLSPLSLILGTWSLSNLNPNWLLSLESPSNWADFESSRDDPSKVWRTLALSSAILGTWSLSPPEPPLPSGQCLVQNNSSPGLDFKKASMRDFEWSGVRQRDGTSWRAATGATSHLFHKNTTRFCWLVPRNQFGIQQAAGGMCITFLGLSKVVYKAVSQNIEYQHLQLCQYVMFLVSVFPSPSQKKKTIKIGKRARDLREPMY